MKQLLSLRDVEIGANKDGEVTSFRDSVMVIGADNEADARDYVVATIAGTQYGLLRGNIVLRDTHAPDTFQFNVEYSGTDYTVDTLPQKKVSFDTGGSTKHITLAVKFTKQKDYPLPGSDAMEFKNLIGVNEDGTVSGVDIPTYNLKFSETHYFLKSKISSSLLRDLKSLTGKINAKPFRGFKIGEALFTGASGSWDQDTRVVSITYNFEVSEDEEDTITYKDAYGDEYQVNLKRGWDYRWIYYAKAMNGSGKVVPKIMAIIDQQVFKEVEFGKLGIGN